MCDEGTIRDCEPTTLRLPFNSYHINLPLYILDMVRIFQDHPKYSNGINDHHILEMLEKEPFACGDLESQIKTALLDLTAKGFIRFISNGYRTLGPIAKLSNARSVRHFNMTWQRIAELQKVNCPSLEPGSISSGPCTQRGSNY